MTPPDGTASAGPPVRGRAGEPAGEGASEPPGLPAPGTRALIAWAAGLLGAACVAWSAAPPGHTGMAKAALVLAIACAAMGALRLPLARVAVPGGIFVSLPLRIWAGFLQLVRRPPWEEGTVLMVLWLEILHPARPWHTAALGAALVAFLLAVHLSESHAPPRVLRPQARMLAAATFLLAAGAGAAMIPAGGAADWLRVIAACAAVAAAALVVPLARAGG
jgi:hypothetical protein